MNFQFTASYEADRKEEVRAWYTGAFNSQPHTRLTQSVSVASSSNHFQFTASYEADHYFLFRQYSFLFSFNSQPHTRLTRASGSKNSNRDLSIHSLIRG